MKKLSRTLFKALFLINSFIQISSQKGKIIGLPNEDGNGIFFLLMHQSLKAMNNDVFCFNGKEKKFLWQKNHFSA